MARQAINNKSVSGTPKIMPTSSARSQPKLPPLSPKNKDEIVTDTVPIVTIETSGTPTLVISNDTPVEETVKEPVVIVANHELPAPTEPLEPPPRVYNDGDVILIYEQYNESFPVIAGSTTAAAVDDVYALSFVMPNCRIRLSSHPPQEKRRLEIEGNLANLYVQEDPVGTFRTLESGVTYYVYVEQDAEQLAADQEVMRAKVEQGLTVGVPVKRDDGRVLESCSCIYGRSQLRSFYVLIT